MDLLRVEENGELDVVLPVLWRRLLYQHGVALPILGPLGEGWTSLPLMELLIEGIGGGDKAIVVVGPRLWVTK
ncbi:hypothetical protein E2562_011082 [Oryza meyeriana var. granulata]|uniref:Uncharacterized protein n=1 Tax=Oryza meyeriana var. granulata TaxID=110450 RepID=A0A6G1EWH5_9ORYZ|nr:hypothetical protein E2562_011082 [Oryza meyeriana var. granulata]